MGKNYQKRSQEERKQEMDLILQKLEDGVRNVFTSENYIRYLETFSKFHSYSFNNIILILEQFPSASHVASFKDWNTKFNRVVKKGEHGIQILVPTPKKFIQDKEISKEDGSTEIIQVEQKRLFFKPGYVFDVSQTIGDDLPSLVKNLEYEDRSLNRVINLIFAKCEIPIQYDYTLQENDANGYYKKDSTEMFLKPTLSSLHKLKTIAHELSHHYQERKYTDITKTYDRSTKEVIAESCAFCTLQMLSNSFGLPTLDSSEYSFGYIAGWGSRDLKELKSTLQIISDISNQIYSDFSNYFQE